jgi:hypothetical protein
MSQADYTWEHVMIEVPAPAGKPKSYKQNVPILVNSHELAAFLKSCQSDGDFEVPQATALRNQRRRALVAAAA